MGIKYKCSTLFHLMTVQTINRFIPSSLVNWYDAQLTVGGRWGTNKHAALNNVWHSILYIKSTGHQQDSRYWHHLQHLHQHHTRCLWRCWTVELQSQCVAQHRGTGTCPVVQTAVHIYCKHRQLQRDQARCSLARDDDAVDGSWVCCSVLLHTRSMYICKVSHLQNTCAVVTARWSNLTMSLTQSLQTRC